MKLFVKASAVVLIVVMLLSFSACRDVNSDSPSPEPPTKDDFSAYTDKIVLSVGDVDLYAVDVCYAYMTNQNVYQIISMLTGNGYDEDTDWSTVECDYDSSISWQDYLLNIVCDDLVKCVCFYGEALKNGYSVTAEISSACESSIDECRQYAEKSGYSFNEYLELIFCPDFTEDVFRRMFCIYAVSNQYYNSVYSSFSYTSEQYRSYYDGNEVYDIDDLNYNVAGVRTITVYKTIGSDTLSEIKTVLEKWLALGGGEENFKTISSSDNQNTTAPSDGLFRNEIKGVHGAAYDSWVFSSDRQYGDNTIIETDDSYMLIFFVYSGLPAWQYISDTNLRNADIDKRASAIIEQYAASLFCDKVSAAVFF